MAITSSHMAFNHAFDIAPLGWKNPVVKMETHSYGVIVFDEALDKKQYSYKTLFDLLSVPEKKERGRNKVIYCVYVNPIIEVCWVYDYREINLETTAIEKIDYVRAMLMDLAEDPTAPFSTVLLKNWYATESMMLLVAQIGKTYWCPLRTNRLVNENGEDNHYIAVKNLTFNEIELAHGKLVSLKSFPKDHIVKLFRVTNKNGSIGHVVTNQLQQDSVDTDHLIGSVYWKAENVCA
jgi:hypothetical protein